MHVNLNRKLVAVAVAALAVTGGGAAIAASKLGSPTEESQAVINDAAQQLGVQPSALSDALTDAVYSSSPYSSRPARETRNANDSVYRNGGSKSMLSLHKSGSGYVAAITMGVHRS